MLEWMTTKRQPLWKDLNRYTAHLSCSFIRTSGSCVVSVKYLSVNNMWIVFFLGICRMSFRETFPAALHVSEEES